MFKYKAKKNGNCAPFNVYFSNYDNSFASPFLSLNPLMYYNFKDKLYKFIFYDISIWTGTINKSKMWKINILKWYYYELQHLKLHCMYLNYKYLLLNLEEGDLICVL